MTNAPAGWYTDPSAPGWQRWWDGNQWTEHVAEPPPPPQPQHQPQPEYHWQTEYRPRDD